MKKGLTNPVLCAIILTNTVEVHFANSKPMPRPRGPLSVERDRCRRRMGALILAGFTE